MYSLKELSEIWAAVYESIGKVFSSSSTELWFSGIRLVHLDNELALMTIPSDFKKQILDTKFPDVLKEHFYNCLGFEVETALISGVSDIKDENEAQLLYENYVEEKRAKDIEESKQQMERAVKVISPQKKKATDYFTFENFISGDSNKFAYNACYAIAHSDEVAYNPLFIHGKSGLGKTHLMYAIINTLLERDPSQKVIYIKGEEFTNTLVEAIKNKTTEQFREKYRTADILLVDDIQFIAGKSSTQDEFFHTFNVLYEAQKQIIVTCDRPIHEMKNLEERIRTRLEWGLSADITPPDTELRIAIIKKKAEEVNLTLPDEVVEFMASKLKDNIRLIEGGIKKLAAMRFIMGKELSVNLVKNEISDLVPSEEPRSAKIEKVIMAVCDKYNISKETIVGKKRTAHIVSARHACMYTLREVLDMTLKDIAGIFSCDHTSVMSAIKNIERKKSDSSEFDDDLNSFIKDLKESLK
ncbi:MAG: chromosomal replication initiator protein DnaA [Clostridia bacterium]|nr:chromosomal replication initiator protein DnaA [Clostridia bacterium]